MKNYAVVATTTHVGDTSRPTVQVYGPCETVEEAKHVMEQKLTDMETFLQSDIVSVLKISIEPVRRNDTDVQLDYKNGKHEWNWKAWVIELTPAKN